MSEIIFNFKGVQNIIQCQHDSKLKDICNNYATKIKHKNLTGIVFLYNGNQIKVIYLLLNKLINLIKKEIKWQY